MGAALQVKNISVHYGGFTALDSINLDLPKHTTLGLVGESGSGKSTLHGLLPGWLSLMRDRFYWDRSCSRGREAASSTKRSR